MTVTHGDTQNKNQVIRSVVSDIRVSVYLPNLINCGIFFEKKKSLDHQGRLFCSSLGGGDPSSVKISEGTWLALLLPVFLPTEAFSTFIRSHAMQTLLMLVSGCSFQDRSLFHFPNCQNEPNRWSRV